MHACLRIGDSQVMASDGMTPNGQPSFAGFSLSYQAKDPADAQRRFEALAKDGQVQMPLGETFFARSFGMVADKFGISWMVIAGGVPLILATLGFTFLGEALRDAFDPRLRKDV